MLTIKTKLIASMMFIAVLVIVIISAALIGTQRSTAREQAQQNLIVLSEIIADNSLAAVLFHDGEMAKQTLSALKAKSDIVHADLLDRHGELFASYPDGIADNTSKSEQLIESLLSLKNNYLVFDDDGLHAYTPLFIDGELIGVLHITDNMGTLRQQLDQFYLLVITTSLIAFLATIIIALWLQSLFSRPLTQLLNVIERISNNKDYSQRAEVKSNDEFTILADNFNNMLAEIEQRDNRLESINSELEQRVVERTKDLQKALELANEANRAKSDFLAIMSHEIRTPLNGVVGFAELLTLHDFDDNVTNMVGLLNDSAQSLLTLLNEILDFSKLDAGKVELDLTEFNLVALIKSTIANQQAVADAKQLNIHFNPSNSRAWNYIGDSIRIRQIIGNLLGNAIKFTEQGSVTIDTAFESLGSDDMVTVRITDTGVGIETNLLTDIFSPFTQADSTVTRKYGGTGLGLAICRQLISLMKGQYGVESEPGKGSCFWFTIPLHPLLSENTVTAPSEPSPTTNTARPGHILVAEDNPINQLVAEGLLESLNHSYEIASNGAEALTLATTKHFDLILMDYHMPVMDGLIATQEIRDLGPDSVNFNTPIIAVTADIQPQVSKQFRHAGANDILLKPFSHGELSNCLNLWLHKTVKRNVSSPAATNSNEPILIGEPLAEMHQLSAESGEDLAQQIIELYLQHTPELIEQIQHAVSDNDTERLFKAAHSLKSSSGNIGAKRIQHIAKLIEQFARDGHIASARELAATLNTIFNSTKRALEEKSGEFN